MSHIEEMITIQLAGLNRQSRCSWSPTTLSLKLWTAGMVNYLQWFRDNHIDIYQDPIDDIWKVGKMPHYTSQQLRVKKMGRC